MINIDKDKISVIIPVYNAERFVSKAINSALNQAETGEVIIIEDGSTDDSLKICKKHENTNNKVKVFQHENGINMGAGASRNLGIQKANFDIIAFLDADDYFLENRFSDDIKLLKNDKKIDGVYNAIGTHIYDISQSIKIKSNITTLKRKISPENLFYHMAPIGNQGVFSCDGLTVRKSIFNKVGFFSTELKITQDTHMWLKMALKTKLFANNIENPVAIRGVHQNNRSIKNEKRIYYIPILYKSLIEWARMNNVSILKRLILWYKLQQANERYEMNLNKRRNSFKYVTQKLINELLIKKIIQVIKFKNKD